ncbi:MAG: hypothetical protein MUO26_07880 [Methanotrichaceae archaeon]|nr:hypothetical protein [Methanotrichaceae archaeon]
MIPYRIILVALISTTITFVNASNANAIDSELSDGWQFSMDMNHFSIETNKSIDQNDTKSKTNDFIVKNDYNQMGKAIISPISFAGLETFNNSSMTNYIDKEMKYHRLSNLSVKPYKIAGAEGVVGRGYDNETGSWVYLAYFPAWPSDSTSNKAVLIVSALGIESSYRLFDTIQVLECPDRKAPLSQLLKSIEKPPQGPAQLESKRLPITQLSGGTSKQSSA